MTACADGPALAYRLRLFLSAILMGLISSGPSADAAELPPLIKIARHGQLGFASPRGSVVVAPRYVGCGPRWSDGFLWVVSSPAVGTEVGNFINGQGREWLDFPCAPWADEIMRISPEFAGGRALVSTLDETWAVVDTRGTVARGLDQPGAEIFPFERDGLWGFIDWSGQVHIPPQFTAAQPFRNDRAPAQQDGTWGLVDPQGHWILPPSCDSIEPGEQGCWIAHRNGTSGILRADGSWLHPPAFREIGSWGSGAVAVRKKHWTLLDLATGKLAFPPVFHDIGPIGSQTAWAKVKHQWGLLGLDGTLRLPFQFESALPNPDNPDLFLVRKGNAEGLADAAGHWLLPCACRSILPMSPTLFLVHSNHTKGLFDISRSRWRVAPAYDDVILHDACPPQGAAIRIGRRWGWILLDEDTPRLPPAFEKLEPWNDLLHARRGNTSALFSPDGQPVLPWEAGTSELPDPECEMVNGFGKIVCHGQAGLIDTHGSIRLPCRFQDVGLPSEELVPAKETNRWGFVDLEGNWIIPPQFDFARPFSDGLAAVLLNGSYGFVNRSGALQIPFGFSDAGYAFQGLIPVARLSQGQPLWGLINAQGTILLPLEYEALEWFDPGPEPTRIYGNPPWRTF